jgi:hypothetical protein
LGLVLAVAVALLLEKKLLIAHRVIQVMPCLVV